MLLSWLLSLATGADFNVTLTDGATLKGKTKDGLVSYLGIPYVETPKRFEPSVFKNLSGHYDARSYGKSCIQEAYIPLFSPPDQETSEDCLTLNIVTPSGKSNLPVLVWIHGGYFSLGSSSLSIYNGRNIVQDFVFVSINYRLGVFGFLGSTLMKEKGALNLGLGDQLQALKWVKKYIHHFGGNPNSITVAGESAGAWSVGNHLLMNHGTQDLFQRAILLSGGPRLYHPTPSAVDEAFSKVVQEAGCSNQNTIFDCLKKVPTFDLRKAGAAYGRYGLVRDGDLVPDSMKSLESGNFSKIPILLNVNKDEGTMFAYAVNTIGEATTFIQNLIPFLSRESQETMKQTYTSTDSPYMAAAKFFADQQFNCPSLLTAKKYSQAGLEVYKSIYTHWSHGTIFLNAIKFLGAFHGSELIHFFRDPLVWWTEKKFSNHFYNHFHAFITQGKPTQSWKPYSDGRYNFVTEKMENDIDLNDRCEMFYRHYQNGLSIRKENFPIDSSVLSKINKQE